jgi:hypothetical protein
VFFRVPTVPMIQERPELPEFRPALSQLPVWAEPNPAPTGPVPVELRRHKHPQVYFTHAVVYLYDTGGNSFYS